MMIPKTSVAERLLIIAHSARALAGSALRAGYRPDAVDAFADSDTRALAGTVYRVQYARHGFERAALLSAVADYRARGGDFHILPGSGFEARPERLNELAAIAPVCGNTAAVVRRSKAPAVFFPILDRLGIPHPVTRLAPPAPDAAPGDWLIKPIGGSGGVGIAPWRAGQPVGSGCYWQRRVSGRPASVVFLADGHACRIAGFNRCWTADGGDWRFGGVIRWSPPARLRTSIADVLTAMTRAFGLRGLCGMDFMLDGDAFQVLEINPRPPASFDLHEGAGSLVQAHLEALAGRLPRQHAGPLACPGKQVLYAFATLAIPAGFAWPDWTCDRPALPARLEPGAPICTIRAAAATVETCRDLLQRRDAYLINKMNNTLELSDSNMQINDGNRFHEADETCIAQCQ